MTICNGAPAEQSALAYVEGGLPEAEAERFEEHFFDCPVCLEYLQTIQAAGKVLAKSPPVALREPSRRKVLLWPAMGWAIASAAAALLVIAIAYRSFMTRPAQTGNTAKVTSPSQNSPQAPAHTPPVQPSAEPSEKRSSETPVELADLTLPVFVAPNLRGDNEDAQFLAGMKAYSNGDCGGARAALKVVSAESRDSRAAQFYSGVCALKIGDLAGAAAKLRAVADAGDSPQQESAYYYLAQVDLARGDAAAAHRNLQRTIALQGDLERKASAQDLKVLGIVDRDRHAAQEEPKNN